MEELDSSVLLPNNTLHVVCYLLVISPVLLDYVDGLFFLLTFVTT